MPPADRIYVPSNYAPNVHRQRGFHFGDPQLSLFWRGYTCL